MDAKAAARAELIREREAGMWSSGEEEFNGEVTGDGSVPVKGTKEGGTE